MLKKTKIDWCDCTLNPVVGCKRNCKYCYARKINDRFHFVEDWTKPQFFPERLKALKSKKPQSIFMDSMSDISFWEKDWLNNVFKQMQKNTQHNYIFLTKDSLPDNFISNDIKEFTFLGLTIDHQLATASISNAFDFLSIEPLLEPIKLDYSEQNENIKLIIIGAETGNRKGKIIPEKKWVDDLVEYADRNRIAVFMKESLREIMGDDFRQDRLLWQK